MRMVVHWLSPAMLAGLLLFSTSGCSGNGVTTSPSTDTLPSTGAKLQDADVVQIKPITLADYEDTIKQLKGKVILVDFWFNT